jgi:hypothetical protein
MALIIGIHDLSGNSLTLIDPEFFYICAPSYRHHSAQKFRDGKLFEEAVKKPGKSSIHSV